MRERGLGDKTRLKSQKHIKAATILHTDGIGAGLHLYLSMCPGPQLAPCPLGGKTGDGLRPGSIPTLALPRLVWCSRASTWAMSQANLQEMTLQAQRQVSTRCRLLKDGVTSKTEGSMELGASEFWLGWGLVLGCYKAGTFCLFRESM